MRIVATACVSALVCAISARSQEPLADGVTTFLGGGSQVAWFEKGGTVWVTDGTVRGTRDTGVPAGSYSVATNRLTVYRQNRIDRLSPDGSTAVLTPPFPFDGFDDDASEPTVWATILHNAGQYWAQISQWGPAGWTTEIRGVQSDDLPPSLPVTPRAGRLLVRWNDPEGNHVSYVTDLFSSTWQQTRQLSTGDPTYGMWTWSGGVCYRTDFWYSTSRRGIATYLDHGGASQVDFPTDWDGQVEELTMGFPVVRGSPFLGSGPTSLLAFTTASSSIFPPPPGSNLALIWSNPSEQVLAHVDQGGARSVLWLDRNSNTWNPTAGFGSPTSVAFLWNFQGASYLRVVNASGASMVRYDETAHMASAIVTGFASIGNSMSSPFAGGFVFAADDGPHGSEPWISDGTTSGTRLLVELRAGSASSNPRSFWRLGERLLFVTDSANGSQVWSMDPLQLDWKRNPDTGRFYRLTSPEPWTVARVEAHNLGGELATVRDVSEHDWLASTFGRDNLWIGLSDFDRDGVFEWASGEPLTFTNWCAGQPDHLPGETVVHLANYPGFCVGGWNDQNPNDTYPGIVERSVPPRPVEEFGVGCSPFGYQPIATARWVGGWPRPGGTVDMRVELGIGYPSTGVLFIGADATAFGAGSLPFDLALLGAPGCFLNIRPDDVIARWDTWNWSWDLNAALRIPNVPALGGAVVFVQAFAFSGYFSWIRTTNALRITIGS